VSSSVGSGAGTDFEIALASLRQQRYRPELRIDEAPAPQRLAPHAVALSAEIPDPADPEGGELATGRLVVLHDPDGVVSWEGTFRVVTFARAALESDLATDPLLPTVGWSWLEEALAAHDADTGALGGTVTRVTSEGFGSLADPGGLVTGQIEIRASWTPLGEPDGLGRHIQAWADLIATAAGLVPAGVGVTRLDRSANATAQR
jgi:hypothetical protein